MSKRFALTIIAMLLSLPLVVYARTADIEDAVGGYIPLGWDNNVEMSNAVTTYRTEPSNTSNEGNNPFILRSPAIPSAYPALCSDTERLETIFSNYPELNDPGDFETSWAYAVGAAAELSNSRSGDYSDLSELALAYGIYKDTTNPVVGEDALGSVSFNGNDKALLNKGGNYYFAGQYLSKGFSFQSEEDYPRIVSGTDARFDDNGNLSISVNSFYDKAKIRMANMSEVDISTSNGKQIIKEAVMAEGAAGISYKQTSTYYSYAYNSYCYPSSTTSNHSVIIVGWDDAFPKDNFRSPPQENGAWLVRNSGSKRNGLFSNTGYFWISYYDKSIQKTAYIFNVKKSTYDNNYYYDTQIHGSASFILPFYAANIFKSKKDETITEVCVELLKPGEVSVKIYTGLTNPNNPESGTLKASELRNMAFPGIFTIPVSNVDVKKGERFSVVVKTDTYTVTFEQPFTSWSDVTATTGIKTGQSFVREDDSSPWEDFETWGYEGNFCIAAHTVNPPSSHSPSSSVSVPNAPVSPENPSIPDKPGTPVESGSTSPEASPDAPPDSSKPKPEPETYDPNVPAKEDVIPEENSNPEEGEIELPFPVPQKKNDNQTVLFNNSSGEKMAVIYNSKNKTYHTSDGKAILALGVDSRYIYTGEKITPGKDSYMLWNETIYECGKDYTVKYKRNKNVGKATATVKWKKDSLPYSYGLKKGIVNFTISKLQVTKDIAEITTTDNRVKSVAIKTNGQTIVAKKKDYDCYMFGNLIIVTFKNNYTGKVKKILDSSINI